jgi:hypothetical protein
MCASDEKSRFLYNLKHELMSGLYSSYQDEISAVYHYTSEQALKSIMKNKTLRFTRTTDLDDKKELEHYFLQIVCVSQGIEVESSIAQLYQKYIKKLLRKVREYLSQIFVLSTSLNGDSRKHWRKYTKDIGYNICLDPRLFVNYLRLQNACTIKPKFTQSQTGDPIFVEKTSVFQGKVGYAPDEQEYEIRKYLMKIVEILTRYKDDMHLLLKKYDPYLQWTINNEIDMIIKYIALKLAIKCIFNKQESFSWEDEFRIAIDFNDPDIQEIPGVEKIVWQGNKRYIEWYFGRDPIAVGCFPIKSISIGPGLEVNESTQEMNSLLDTLKYDALGIDKIKILPSIFKGYRIPTLY